MMRSHLGIGDTLLRLMAPTLMACALALGSACMSSEPGAVGGTDPGATPDPDVGGGLEDAEVDAGPVRPDLPANTLVVHEEEASALGTGRVGHTLTLIDQGEVLVAGGSRPDSLEGAWWTSTGLGDLVASLERVSVDLATLEVATSSAGELAVPRAWHTATGLPDGMVVIAGGWVESGATRSIERFDPSDGSVAEDPAGLLTERAGHSASVVGTAADPDAPLVLFVGGDAEGTWELWHPTEGSLSGAPEPLPDGVRSFHAATRFLNESTDSWSVLITGGASGDEPGTKESILIYEASTGQMRVHSASLGPRFLHASAWVEPRGYVYVLGGFVGVGARAPASDSIAVYDVFTDEVIDGLAGFKLNTARAAQTALPMAGNRVLISGGLGDAGALLDSIELIGESIDPVSGNTVIAVGASGQEGIPSLPAARAGQRAVALTPSIGLVAGGLGDPEGDVVWPTEVLLFVP